VGKRSGYVQEKKVMIKHSKEGNLLMKERRMAKGPIAKHLMNG
jgi:hypothetical protein